MPILEDSYSEAMPDSDNFADSPLQLSGPGTTTRSKAQAIALRSQI